MWDVDENSLATANQFHLQSTISLNQPAIYSIKRKSTSKRITNVTKRLLVTSTLELNSNNSMFDSIYLPFDPNKPSTNCT